MTTGKERYRVIVAGVKRRSVEIIGILLAYSFLATLLIMMRCDRPGVKPITEEDLRRAAGKMFMASIMPPLADLGTQDHGATAAEQPGPPWAPASHVVKQGDVQIRVVSAFVGEVELQGFRSNPYWSADSCLKIVLEVSNLSRIRKIPFSSWGEAGHYRLDSLQAAVCDNYGNTYDPGAHWYDELAEEHDGTGSFYPGSTRTDVLVFEPPIAGIEYLRLELPAVNFGGTGVIRFQIPASMINR